MTNMKPGSGENDMTSPASAPMAELLTDSPAALLGELLAVMHQDGGHHQAAVGTPQAVQDALTEYYRLRAIEHEAALSTSTGQAAPPTVQPSDEVDDLRDGLGQIAVRIKDDPTMLRCCRLIDEALGRHAEDVAIMQDNYQHLANRLHAAVLALASPQAEAPVAAEGAFWEPLAVTDLPPFPTMLRQMWSGGQVQQWIDDNIKPMVQERHFHWHCEADSPANASPPKAATPPAVVETDAQIIDRINAELISLFERVPSYGLALSTMLRAKFEDSNNAGG